MLYLKRKLSSHSARGLYQLVVMPAWTKKESKSKPGKFYYFNKSTGETLWKLPKRSSSSSSSSSSGGGARKKRRVDEGGEKVTVSHILAKHVGSRNPISWRDADAVTRTKAEAIAIVEADRAQLEACDTDAARAALFARLATDHSDCSSGKTKDGVERGGKMNAFGRGAMQPPFEEAAFALKVGELSGIVDSASGVHVILLHSRKEA